MSETAPAPRAAVVYESMFGNTSHVAHAVADGLRAAGCDTETAEVNTAPEPHPDVALLVVGAPTHAFSLSRPRTRQDAVSQGAPPTRAGRGLREWLQETEPPGPATGMAVFDTRVSKARRLPAAGRAAALPPGWPAPAGSGCSGSRCRSWSRARPDRSARARRHVRSAGARPSVKPCWTWLPPDKGPKARQ
jgi:hypothetical protein